MRALHVIAGLDRNSGGPAYSVPRLCAALLKESVETPIYTVRGRSTLDAPSVSAYKQDFSGVPLLRAFRLSAQLAQAIETEAYTLDIVHSHGLWLMPNVYAGKIAAKARKPLVVSPRGMLAREALAFSIRKKRTFWQLLQGPAYRHTAVWHATSAAEAADIRSFGIRSAIAIIPNGIDIPSNSDMLPPRNNKQREVLFLGRVHPKKGLPDLIAAWSKISRERPNWMLRIVGPDEGGHRAQLEKMVLELNVPRVLFNGPVYGAEKGRALSDADLFVLPTQNENFGIAVAEALASGIPAIVSRGAPWPGLETNRCGWWVERGVEPLVNALREATGLRDDERRIMGERGRAFVERDYSWDTIAQAMRSVYEWAIGKAERPPMVHLD